MITIHLSTVVLAIIVLALAVLCTWLWRKNGNGNGRLARASDLAMENSARCRQLERRILAIERRLEQFSVDAAFARAREGQNERDTPDQ